MPHRPYKGLEEHLDSLVKEKQVNDTVGAPDRPVRILLVGERKSGKTTCCMTAARMLRENGLRPGGVV